MYLVSKQFLSEMQHFQQDTANSLSKKSEEEFLFLGIWEAQSWI